MSENDAMTQFAKRVLIATAALACVSTAAVAQQACADRRPSTLSTAVARTLEGTFEKLNNDDFAGVIADTNRLLERNPTGYDRAIILQIRASAYANSENYQAALRDFIAAVDLNVFPCNTETSLKQAIGQLYLATENYTAAIRYLEEWLSSVEEPDAQGYYILASAYTAASRFRDALRPAEQAVALQDPPKENQHTLLNYIYSETDNQSKRLQLLEKMVSIWSGKKSYWTQYSALLNTSGRERDAFSVLELAYRAGLLERENEFIQLAQYYAFFDNPFRGGKMLEREMSAGNIERDEDNLILLASLWTQAREHERAIDPLERAARISDTGRIFLRLAQVYYADERFADAERAARSGLRKGGLSADDTAQLRMTLGYSLYSQEEIDAAREQFAIASGNRSVARQAQAYITYIDELKRTRTRQAQIDREQAAEAARRERERLEAIQGVQALSGQESGDDDDGDEADDDDSGE
ncbi:MAG: tetratricopeptide repeat protein [Pseudomonadota bacterium]